jgi:hypothetical protein
MILINQVGNTRGGLIRDETEEPNMKVWAEKRRRELEAAGDMELAHVFELVVRMCEVDEVFPCPKAATISPDSLDASKPT